MIFADHIVCGLYPYSQYRTCGVLAQFIPVQVFLAQLRSKCVDPAARSQITIQNMFPAAHVDCKYIGLTVDVMFDGSFYSELSVEEKNNLSAADQLALNQIKNSSCTIGQIVYSATWLKPRGEHENITADPSIIHINRKLGVIVQHENSTGMVLIAVDSDYSVIKPSSLNDSVSRNISDSRISNLKFDGTEQVRIQPNDGGKSQYIEFHPTQPKWLKMNIYNKDNNNINIELQQDEKNDKKHNLLLSSITTTSSNSSSSSSCCSSSLTLEQEKEVEKDFEAIQLQVKITEQSAKLKYDWKRKSQGLSANIIQEFNKYIEVLFKEKGKLILTKDVKIHFEEKEIQTQYLPSDYHTKDNIYRFEQLEDLSEIFTKVQNKIDQLPEIKNTTESLSSSSSSCSFISLEENLQDSNNKNTNNILVELELDTK